MRGILTAYMADQYLLGREEEGWRRLDGALHRGELGPGELGAHWPVGAAYIRKLHLFLREKGYAT